MVMNIRKLQQSGVIIESSDGFKLAIDIANKTPIEELENLKADAFIVSHIHGDHFSLPHINALQPETVYLNNECKAQVNEPSLTINTIRSGDTIQIADGTEIQVFSVDHGPNASAPLAENFGFLINVDSHKIYFAGDMFYESGIDVSNLEADYVLIPVGGFYTFGPDEAIDFLKKFKSIKKVIPIHYDKTPETKDEFLKLVKDIFSAE